MKKILTIIAVAVLLLCFTGCDSNNTESHAAAESKAEVVEAAEMSDTLVDLESTETAGTHMSDAESFAGGPMGWNGMGEVTDDSAYVNTPYGDLYYPVEYADLLNVDITEDDYYSVAFSGRSSVGDVFLFIVYFGREDYGETIGTYETENGDTMAVTCQMCELDLDDRWSESEKDQLAEEQTAVSAYVVENLVRIQGYTTME